MKILKILFGFILILIILFFILALCLPKEYTVSVSQTIKAPHSQVFDYVKLLKTQEQYSVWIMDQKDIIVSYKGVDGQVGAVQAWDTPKHDNTGEQEITHIDSTRIDVELRFKAPMASTQKASMLLKSVNANETIITSEFYGQDDFPWNAFSFIGKKMIHDAEVRNLENIRKILEKN